MSTSNGLVGADFDPVETVVSSEESIRDSVDFQEEEYCEEQVEQDDDQQEPDHSSSCNKMAASPTKSITDSDSVPSSATNGYPESVPGTPGAIGHQEFWDMFTGLKVKQYSDQELEAFKGPFLKGWRREVVLRGTVTNSGKKIGDVYYYSPDKKTKLRSYVEMGLFLKKNSGCGLEPENFTFARQPVYRPPEEIVRHAMTRGSNQLPDQMGASPPEPVAAVSSVPAVPPAPAAMPVPATLSPAAKPQVVTRRSQSNASSVDPVTPETPDTTSLLTHEGRSKRKRVAPTRFEDEEYLDNSPFKKKSEKSVKTEKPISTLATGTAAAAAPALKSVETKVNAQGRPSLIIRTPIRKAVVAPAAESKPQTQVQNPLSANAKSAEAKDATHTQSLGIASSNGSSDSEVTAATRSEDQTASRPEPVAQVNGSHKQQPQMNPSPPPLQPILPMPQVTAAAADTPQTAARKDGRPAAAPILTRQIQQPVPPNMRKASGQNKSGRSILTPGSNQQRAANDPGSSFKPIRPKPAPSVTEPADVMDGVSDDMGMVPPCSIMCGGGQLPSLLCSRCLCLFHPQCVQRGIHLVPGNQFVCPNCIQPSDQGRPIGVVNGHQEESGSRSASKTQSSSRNSSRGGSPLHTGSSLIRNQLKSTSKSHQSQQNHHVNHSIETISTMMDKRQQSQLQLLQTFQQIAGIRSKGTVSDRPVMSRPVPLVKKQHIVQNRGHLRLAAGAGRDSRPQLLPGARLTKPKPRPQQLLPQHQPPVLQAAAAAAPVPTASNHQHLSELISHHLESVSKLLQEITMLKYSNCQKASTDRPQRRKRSHSV